MKNMGSNSFGLCSMAGLIMVCALLLSGAFTEERPTNAKIRKCYRNCF